MYIVSLVVEKAEKLKKAFPSYVVLHDLGEDNLKDVSFRDLCGGTKLKIEYNMATYMLEISDLFNPTNKVVIKLEEFYKLELS